MNMRIGCLLALLAVVTCAHAEPLDVQSPAVVQFINETAIKTHLDRQSIQEILKHADLKQSVVDAMDRPAEKTKAWFEYRAIFMTEKRVRDGVAFIKEHQAKLDEVSARTGVPREIITAIVGIETGYGQNMGRYRVLDTLATLTFNYPARASYFRGELQEFLLLCKENNIDPTQVLGSYAGAMGAPQFMPHSYRQMARDGDGDGKVDLWGDWPDVIESVAHYFSANGWRSQEPIVVNAQLSNPDVVDLPANQLETPFTLSALRQKGVQFDSSVSDTNPGYFLALNQGDHLSYAVGLHNFYVITRYNHSPFYALVVSELAQALADGGDGHKI